MFFSCCRSCTVHFKKYFVDLQFMGILMSIWLLVVLFVLYELGVFSQTKFVAFGPRSDLTFMHVAIDTYYKYNILICMIVVHTFVTDVIADSLAPHVLNVVQDTKNKYLPHRAKTYVLITTMWSIYCSVSQLFVIFIAFGQLDLLLVRLASDLLANFTTLNMYLDGKIYDPHLHSQSFLHPLRSDTGESQPCKHDDDADPQREKIILFSIHDEEEEGDDKRDLSEEGLRAHDSKKISRVMEKEMSNLRTFQTERHDESTSGCGHHLSEEQPPDAPCETLLHISNAEDDEKQALLANKQK